jgi:hypothetical protein
LQANFLLPATTIQSIINEFQTVHEIGQKHVVALLKKKLLAFDVSADVVDQALGEFNRSDNLKQCNEGILRSDASRKTFDKSNFFMLNLLNFIWVKMRLVNIDTATMCQSNCLCRLCFSKNLLCSNISQHMQLT